MIIITIIVTVILVLYIIATYYTIVLSAPYVPSNTSALNNLLANVDLSDRKKFYELGSGDGKVISKIAQKYTDMECIGIEYNYTAYLLSLFRNLFLERKVKYFRKDFFKVDLKDADVVFTYLFPDVMQKLHEKFKKELKPGAIVISNTFAINDMEPISVYKGKGYLNTIYIYKF